MRAAFSKAADAVRRRGAFQAAHLREPEMQALTAATQAALMGAVDTGITQEIPDRLRAALSENVFIFSAMKTYTGMAEASAQLLDEQGRPRSLHDFGQQIGKLNATYNQNYLEAEYQFAAHSAQMAARWAGFEESAGRYDLQYRTAADDKVRASHQPLHNVTLPMDDPFWSSYYPPNGWRCFPPGTPILTAAGWKPIEEIKRSDYVIGGSGKQQFVGATYANPFHGHLITLSAKGARATCTPNHRFLTSKGWLAAERIEPGNIMLQVGEISFANKLLNGVHNAYTLLLYGLMALKRKRQPSGTLNVDCQAQSRNVEVDEIPRERSPELKINTHAGKAAFHKFLRFCRWRFQKVVSLRVRSSCGNTGGHGPGAHIRPEEGTGGSKLFGYGAYKWAIGLVYALAHMPAHCRKLMIGSRQHTCGTGTPGICMNPLRGNGLAAIARRAASLIYCALHGALIYRPKGCKLPVTELLSKVPKLQGLRQPATFQGFNTCLHFLAKTFFHNRYILIVRKDSTLYNGTVYNLSVWEDESYVTEIGITHNCRCTVVEVRKGKHPVSDPAVAAAAGEAATTQIGKDGKNKLAIFRTNPGKTGKVFPGDHPYLYAGNCGTQLSANGNDKCRALEIVKEDAAAKFGRVQKRAAEYEKLKKDKNYTDVQFDAATGGLKATHVLHNFDRKKGHYEKEATRVLYADGHKVILGSEIAAEGVKTPDGKLNDKLFEIKAVESKGKNSIKRKLNEALSQGSEHVVLYYPDAGIYDPALVQEGHGKYLGVLAKEGTADKIGHIWIVAGDKIHVFK